MMVEMSRIADEYGLDVSIWYPAMDRDYSDPKTVEFALKEWGDVFRQLPRIDAVFVPGGDHGHTQLKYLLAWLEKQTANLPHYQAYSNGFVTYSEGCNDDVNKFVWSGLGWNPDANVKDILREYSRFFIGDDVADAFAQGLLSLEQNWKGPLLSNSGVDTTLE